MKPFVFFSIVFTLAELFFSSCYYFLTGRFGGVIIFGAIIYLLCLAAVYIIWRSVIYSEKRKALIDALP